MLMRAVGLLLILAGSAQAQVTLGEVLGEFELWRYITARLVLGSPRIPLTGRHHRFRDAIS